jgi:O-antigen/teichoic acid export membrane protein
VGRSKRSGNLPEQLTSPAEGSPSVLTATVVRGAGVTTAGHLLTQAITLGFYIVLARLAGPAVFGVFAAAWLIVGVSSFLTDSGMGAALIQRRDQLEEAAATAVLSTIATGTGIGLVALALAPVVGLYFHSREIGVLSAALAGVPLMNAAAVVPDALMRRRFSFVRRTIVDPINAATYGIVGVITLSVGMKAWGLVIATYAAGTVGVSTAWIFNRWLPDLRRASFAMWRQLASYAWHVAVSEFLREINGVANIAIVGRLLGIATLGAYRFGSRIAMEAATPLAASLYVLLPAFARIASDLSRFQRAFLRSTRLLSAIIFPTGFLLLLLGEQLMIILLGERWKEAGHVLSALSGATTSLVLIYLVTEILKAANRPDLLPRMMLVRTVGSILLMIAFVSFGATGVAAGVSLAFMLAAIYGLRDVCRVLKLSLRTVANAFWPPMLASIGMTAILTPFIVYVVHVEHSGTATRLGWLAIQLILGLAVYGTVLFKISPATASELKHVLRRLLRAERHKDVTAARPESHGGSPNETGDAATL